MTKVVLFFQFMEDSPGREFLEELLCKRLAKRLVEAPAAFVGLLRFPLRPASGLRPKGRRF